MKSPRLIHGHFVVLYRTTPTTQSSLSKIAMHCPPPTSSIQLLAAFGPSHQYRKPDHMLHCIEWGGCQMSQGRWISLLSYAASNICTTLTIEWGDPEMHDICNEGRNQHSLHTLLFFLCSQLLNDTKGKTQLLRWMRQRLRCVFLMATLKSTDPRSSYPSAWPPSSSSFLSHTP